MDFNAVYLNLADSGAELGSSRFFGAPDLPEEFDWPVDSQEYDMEFICQINLKDACDFCEYLPKSGMLYFFGCIASALGAQDAPEISMGLQEKENFAVIYVKCEDDELLEGEIVDENGEDCTLSASEISFSAEPDEQSAAFHRLFGERPNDFPLEDYVPLLCVDSFEGEDFSLEFLNGACLYFMIKKDDLLRGDFSDTVCFLAEE